MGKATCYHPVSLHVIRGAAEYCGFKFSKITQKRSSREKGTATYSAHIERMPDGLSHERNNVVKKALQSCFMDDIRVDWLHQTKSGKWTCELQVELDRALDHAPSLPGGGGGFDGRHGDGWEYDGLHVCSVCGDTYTIDDVCWRCRQQVMIDMDVPTGIQYEYCRDCGGSFPVGDLVRTEMDGMLCERCFTIRRES